MTHPVPPTGALTKKELLSLVKPGKSIYKVFKKLDGVIGHTSHAICSGEIENRQISTKEMRTTIYFDSWFEKEYGYLFDNYFHALAYSLKLKADHGKAQSKERTGVEGAP